ncbi:MAG: transpeptidase family protein [Bacteroidia bacterium]|nr:transpeptidase family protein [Bacteroidia bacterium]
MQKDILRRVYVVYIFSAVFALAVVGRVFYIQFAQGDYWKQEAQKFTVREMDIEAVRGNIFAIDGSLLATSLPYYNIGVDTRANAFINDAEFEDSVAKLTPHLERLLSPYQRKTAREYTRELLRARNDSDRYVEICRGVSYNTLQDLKKLPLFRCGRYRGGFIYIQSNRRELPFRTLAARTIGYIKDSLKVGLEGAYDSLLTGVGGKRLMRRIAAGAYMPINDENEIEPQDGKDIVSTIDINIQDVAENALMNSLAEHNARYGTCVLMEVATGEIRAIANLTRADSGVYRESYNYAIGDAREPGSTFKLASLLVGMDENLIDLDDKVDLNGGQYKFFDRTMKDSHAPKKNLVTAEEAFWESSNVGISRLVHKAFARNPKKFTDGLHRIGLGQKLNVALPGEGKSRVKDPKDRDWSGVSLPWISIGYESLITPLQTLTLYNAVANNGKMMKPMFVKEVRDKGQVIQRFEPQVINPAIAKPQTIAKARRLLEGVVQNGTGKSMGSIIYKVAGKTGTAQIAQGGIYKGQNGVTYQASFVGYFPADQPKYSCIVIVNAPSGDAYYGGVVAGPIFKQIADRIYATELDIHKAVNASPIMASLPAVQKGFAAPTLMAMKQIGLPAPAQTGTVTAIKVSENRYTATAIQPDQKLSAGTMPDLSGMTAIDCLALLENRGIRVKIMGSGTVSRQSLAPGTPVKKGSEVILELTL